jgi:hypothetical protein
MTNGRLPDVDSMLPSPTEAVAAWLGAYGVLKKKGITGFAVLQAWRREYFLARQTVIAVLMQQPKRTVVVGHDAWTARYDLEVDAWLIDWHPAINGKERAA